MATLFKEISYNLNTLIQQIDLGTIGLPDIQRPFVWKDVKVRDLFDSMYRGFPVGYFLFWDNYHYENTKGIGIEKKQKYPSQLIVDGQQRLTSLYAVIKGHNVIRENYDITQIVIAFNPLSEKFEVPDASIKNNPRFFQNISDLWKPDANLFRITSDFINHLSSKVELTDADINQIQESLMKLKNLENYPFSTLSLSANISEEQVAEVFVRINSQGKKLNQADFILTLMSVFWEDGRKNLENFCGLCRKPTINTVSPFNYILTPNPDDMLRVSVGLSFRRARLQYVYSILRGKDLETGEFSDERRDLQFNKLSDAQKKALDLTNWHEFLQAIKLAGFNRNDYISSQANLIYTYVFFLIGREDYKVDYYELRKLIARWFFMCNITRRYTGSPETVMEMDLAKLRGIESANEFVKLINQIIESQLNTEFWEFSLPMELSTSSSFGPGQNAYYAALKILDANGLFSKLKVSELLQNGIRAKKSPLERHHLFPKAWLIRNGITEQAQTNQVANFALVEWNDNIKISDEHPQRYLPIYLQRFTEEEINQMYYFHALPKNWENMDYFDFLKERRKLMSEVIKFAYEKL